jgi:hypothetical protein
MTKASGTGKAAGMGGRFRELGSGCRRGKRLIVGRSVVGGIPASEAVLASTW